MKIDVSTPDPSWQVAIEVRKAVLWIGPSFTSFAPGDAIDSIRLLLGLPWAAVYVDAPDAPWPALKQLHPEVGSLILRFFDREVEAVDLPPNRLPVFYLRGPFGTVSPGDTADPSALLNRYAMLRRMPAGCEVFAVGLAGSGDFAGVTEAVSISTNFRRLIVVGTHPIDVDTLAKKADRLVHWRADWHGFLEMLAPARAATTLGLDSRIRIRTPSGLETVDLGECIDPSYPITDSFELIPFAQIVAERNATEADLQAFLEDPSASWRPYAAGIPYARHRQYETAMFSQLKKLVRDGPSASFTSWLPAENGSGATTVLRHLCFDLARDGYPILVARRDVLRFDFSQLSAFLTAATNRFRDTGVPSLDLPWILAFDADHTQLHWEFLAGLCNGLKRLEKSVAVLAVRADGTARDEIRLTAFGTNRVLGSALANCLSLDECVELGEHLGRFLPSYMKRRRSEWETFICDTVRTTVEGRSSLFWVALRFWLFRLPGADESMRHWLAAKVKALAHDSVSKYAALMETAVLAKHRLPAPYSLLSPDSSSGLRAIADDSTNALGVRQIRGHNLVAVTYSHPLVAEEVLRIAQDDVVALSAVGKDTCVSLLDLELHLLGRLINRPTAGSNECAPIMEELVTTGLRVDPREAPRNYQVRERIVTMLEHAPTALWDGSQLFNHHVAKARRHLAIDPPERSWTVDQRRKQLQLAEKHLLDALHHIQVDDEDRRESPLNLWVSLALTYDARCRLEEESGATDIASQYRQQVEKAYETAQRMDTDNTYVLENLARFRLRLARVQPAGTERTQLIVDAIALLERERIADEAGYRDEPTMVELANAYSLLEENNGQHMLGRLAARGTESALVALAKLALRKHEAGATRDDILAEAEQYLLRVRAADATWRSMLALYDVVKERRPHDFHRRLELLKELDSQRDFAWPQQLRLEYGILLFQVGDPANRKKGSEVYRRFRDELADRSGSVRIPEELRFLADPTADFRKRLRTFVVVKNISDVGKSSYGIPNGWGTLDIAFRAYRFGRDNIRPKKELDCYIQFTNFGPQAVPHTTE